MDLRLVRGSGPAGRIGHEDLDGFIASGGIPAPSGPQPDQTVEDIRVIGLRRKIAERMEAANRVPRSPSSKRLTPPRSSICAPA